MSRFLDQLLDGDRVDSAKLSPADKEAIGRILTSGEAIRETREQVSDNYGRKIVVYWELISDRFAYNWGETNPALNVSGSWGHALPVRWDLEDEDPIGKIWDRATTPSEICVSDAEETDTDWFNTRHDFAVLVFSGECSAVYPCDCWSELCPVTRRRIATEAGNPYRTEGFLTAATATVRGIVVTDDCPDDQRKRLAELFGAVATVSWDHLTDQAITNAVRSLL